MILRNISKLFTVQEKQSLNQQMKLVRDLNLLSRMENQQKKMLQKQIVSQKINLEIETLIFVIRRKKNKIKNYVITQPKQIRPKELIHTRNRSINQSEQGEEWNYSIINMDRRGSGKDGGGQNPLIFFSIGNQNRLPNEQRGGDFINVFKENDKRNDEEVREGKSQGGVNANDIQV
ncbi:unnamed protein product [Paramecium sonneborni]|uniref:Uncharacterized protein n=1 Tax=Paramecium sonneborni TaxID=65129 RepID=A0A8S1QIF8_9CILI|nr:unnamed protein product [Paramecium sonneborni]